MAICPVCNSLNTRVYIYFRNYVYRRCQRCTSVFLDNRWLHLDEKSLYTSDYIRERGHNSLESSIARAKKATAGHYLSLLESYASGGNLLEIGCSTGITLKTASDRGWRIYGIDINEAAVSIARKFLNSETIRTGYLDDGISPDDFFSAVLMFDVLEHINNPLAFFKILNKKIRHSGFLLVITPNINSLSAKILKGKWSHLFLEHLCFYSPKSIKFLLEGHQFKVLKIGWAIKFINIDIIKHHLKCHPHVLLSRPALYFLNRLTVLSKIIFPFNIGEMYVLAQRK